MQKTNALGEELRLARGKRSIEALADELEVSRNTLGSYERGDTVPEVDFLVAFSNKTGADLGKLLGMRLAVAGVGHEDSILTALVFTAQGNPDLWRRASEAAGISGGAMSPLPEGGTRQLHASYAAVDSNQGVDM